jgi:hypothetical protein
MVPPMKRTTIVVASLAVLSGCFSSGVIPMDRGSYMITKRSAQLGIGMPVGTKADVYKEANDFCSKQGMMVDTINLEMAPSRPASPGSVSLQFRCVPHGSLPTQAIQLQREPDVIIEKRGQTPDVVIERRGQ